VNVRPRVRPRVRADLPALERVLMEQQAETRYPFRDPLPIPFEEFVHADDALGAWTAVLDGEVVGHVCHTGPGLAELDEPAADAHGCAVSELGWVSTLFVGSATRGLGVGRLLLATAVADLRARGLRPSLEVLSVHPAAVGLYAATGWREVHRLRPQWLLDAAGDDAPDVAVMVLD
jgi:GNAT superfamily N-acetyltransferase